MFETCEKSRDNSLRIDLCINTVVKQDGQIPSIFIEDIKNWTAFITELENELTIASYKSILSKNEIEDEKTRILNKNREDALRAEHSKRTNELIVETKAEQKPLNVAIGGPENYIPGPTDPRKRNSVEFEVNDVRRSPR